MQVRGESLRTRDAGFCHHQFLAVPCMARGQFPAVPPRHPWWMLRCQTQKISLVRYQTLRLGHFPMS